MKARTSIFLAACLAFSVHSPALSSRDYNYPDFVLHTIEGQCNGDRIFAEFSTWARGRESVGLQKVEVGPNRLSSAELRTIESQFRGKRIVEVSIVGCRRTSQGDNRVWFTVESEHPDPTTSALPISKSFFVRAGRLEFHEKAPVD